MSDLTERKLGWGFGILGGVLIVVAAIVSVFVGTFDLVTGRVAGALDAGTEAVLLLAVGALALFFSYLAYRPWSDHPITAGVLLVVLAAIGWGVLGLGGNVIALLGALFVFLAGILFLLQPALSSVKALATA
jgi:hypothetical protein